MSTCSRAHSSVCAREQRNRDESKQPDSRETRRRNASRLRQHHHRSYLLAIITSHTKRIRVSPHLEETPNLLTHRPAQPSAIPHKLISTSSPPTFGKRHDHMDTAKSMWVACGEPSCQVLLLPCLARTSAGTTGKGSGAASPHERINLVSIYNIQALRRCEDYIYSLVAQTHYIQAREL